MGNFLSSVINWSTVTTQSQSETPFLRSVCNFMREIIVSDETLEIRNMGAGNCVEESDMNSGNNFSVTNSGTSNDSLSSEFLSLSSSQAFLLMLNIEDTTQPIINESNALPPNERDLSDDSSAYESTESGSFEATNTSTQVSHRVPNTVCGDNSDITSDSSVATIWYDASTSAHQSSELG